MSGYGKTGREMAHRVAYRIWKGRPKNLVLHKCDVKPCVNPEHLYDGTYTDNRRDYQQRGRYKGLENAVYFCGIRIS